MACSVRWYSHPPFPLQQPSSIPPFLQEGRGLTSPPASRLVQVVYMVQFYGVATLPQDVGYYTGIMVGAFLKS